MVSQRSFVVVGICLISALLPAGPTAAVSCSFSVPAACGDETRDALLKRARERMQEPFESPEAHGAAGTGQVDDSAALEKALANGRPVRLTAGKIYRIDKPLNLPSKSLVYGESSDATILLHRESFNNRDYGDWDKFFSGQNGTALRIRNVVDVALVGFQIRAESYDDVIAIAMEIGRSTDVVVSRLDIVGFSLAPGIVTIRSSQNVLIHETAIHDSHSEVDIADRCSKSQIPDDNERGKCRDFHQITGIVIDAARFKDSSGNALNSSDIRITENTIYDLFLYSKSEQADGVNWAETQEGKCLSIDRNRIFGVGEAIDIGGARDVVVRDNILIGRDVAIKLVHGASRLNITANHLVASEDAVGGLLVGATLRPVTDIMISKNMFDRHASTTGGLIVGHPSSGTANPGNICVRDNVFLGADCAQQVHCNVKYCNEQHNISMKRRGGICP